MKLELIVTCDTEKKPNIRIRYTHPNQKPNIELDTGILCEALVTLIRCRKSNEDQAKALSCCINHLQKGFADETFKATIE